MKKKRMEKCRHLNSVLPASRLQLGVWDRNRGFGQEKGENSQIHDKKRAGIF